MLKKSLKITLKLFAKFFFTITKEPNFLIFIIKIFSIFFVYFSKWEKINKEKKVFLLFKSLLTSMMLFYKYLYYSELYIQILENSHLPSLIYVPYILLTLLFTYVLYYYYVVDYLLTKEKILYSIAFAFFIGLLIDLAVVLISKYIFYMN